MTIQISLSGRLENLVLSKIKAGGYKDANEVIDAALSRFSLEDEISPEEMAYLNSVIDECEKEQRNGKAQSVDGEAFFSKMEQYINDFPV